MSIGIFDISKEGLPVGTLDSVLALQSLCSQWKLNPGPRSSVKNNGISDSVMERMPVGAFYGSTEKLPVSSFDGASDSIMEGL